MTFLDKLVRMDPVFWEKLGFLHLDSLGWDFQDREISGMFGNRSWENSRKIWDGIFGIFRFGKYLGCLGITAGRTPGISQCLGKVGNQDWKDPGISGMISREEKWGEMRNKKEGKKGENPRKNGENRGGERRKNQKKGEKHGGKKRRKNGGKEQKKEGRVGNEGGGKGERMTRKNGEKNGKRGNKNTEKWRKMMGKKGGKKVGK